MNHDLSTITEISQLHKSADLVLEIPAGTSFWAKNEHEPLILAFYFPMFELKPWFCKGTNLLESFKTKSQILFLEGRDTIKFFRRLLQKINSLQNASVIQTNQLLSFNF